MFIQFLSGAAQPSELSAMVKLKLSKTAQPETDLSLHELAGQLNDRDFCYAALNKVSRSFAMVIQQLPEELRDPVCVFYLVLRGLDTVEDDMRIPLAEKVEMLSNFHLSIADPDWCRFGIGDSREYSDLMAHFHKVNRVYLSLDKKYRSVISDICQRMSHGMQEFAQRKVETVADYDLYCHYVAGLVGYGLSDLFAASGCESAHLSDLTKLSNSMGLLLQKTNITRDIHEDAVSGRNFWPSEIYGKHVAGIRSLIENPESKHSLSALNEMVTDALRHLPDCLKYLMLLRDEKVFRFCAIPQVMAVSTLALVYNNADVLKTVVKIRKGLAAKIMMNTRSMRDVNEFCLQALDEMAAKVSAADPNYLHTLHTLNHLRELCGREPHHPTLF